METNVWNSSSPSEILELNEPTISFSIVLFIRLSTAITNILEGENRHLILPAMN